MRPFEPEKVAEDIRARFANCRQVHMANLSKIYLASQEKIADVWGFESSDSFSEADRAALRLAYFGALSPSEATNQHFDVVRCLRWFRP